MSPFTCFNWLNLVILRGEQCQWMGLATQTGRNWAVLSKDHQQRSIADLPRMIRGAWLQWQPGKSSIAGSQGPQRPVSLLERSQGRPRQSWNNFCTNRWAGFDSGLFTSVNFGINERSFFPSNVLRLNVYPYIMCKLAAQSCQALRALMQVFTRRG